ncbi:MAG: peptidase S41, partial [Candidatus Thiodiazotropha sp.]
IQAEGIEPDIELEELTLSKTEESQVKPIKESNLSGHLLNGNGDEPESSKAPGAEPVDENEELVKSDYQLGEALNLLKGLVILRSKRTAG